ncbi:MAG: HAD family hydrolase [Lactobacillus sp.]|jgi:Cof subfamily protein (haloacid dehalogenase superfamily)|nr:HAD family hydrolase [Lactobacillus sp.]MCI2031990.1 HAD family hydrolase [Lactobacillus sp.]
MIKHVFSDMDGTLLNSQGRLAPSNAALIHQAGLPVTLVSARAPIEMLPAITALHLQGPQIAFNGGLIFRLGAAGIEPLTATPLPAASAQTLLRQIHQQFPTVSLSFYDRKRWYTTHIDAGIRYEQRLTEQAPELLVTGLEAAASLTLFKLMMITFDPDEMQALETFLRALAVPGVAIQRSGSDYLEITSQQATKAHGLHYLFTANGLTRADTAAFGDGHNDLPMLTRVGTPIAMANAQPEVLAACTHVTASNDDDGVGVGIHRFLLQQ